MAGNRGGSNGSLGSVGSNGVYWSSTVSGASSRILYFFSSGANTRFGLQASGLSVRCLKD
jgi:hypothetical protein